MVEVSNGGVVPKDDTLQELGHGYDEANLPDTPGNRRKYIGGICRDQKPADTAGKDKAEAVEAEVKEKKPKGEKYPYGASVNMGYAFNHSNFVESNGDFGWQRLSLGANVSYMILEKVSLSTGLGVSKVLATAYDNSGGSSKNTKAPWEINDISVSSSYSFYKIPVVDISLSASLGLGFPLSKASSSAGPIMSTSPGLSASWSAAGFSVGLMQATPTF